MDFTLPNGYKSKTTFFMDFSIADHFGESAIKDTYHRAFNEWKDNVIFLTELVIVLNLKIWEHYQRNDKIALLYNDLWEKSQNYVYETLKGDDLKYYFSCTD